MISIQKAAEKDYQAIVDIGRVSVTKAHEDSCSAEILGEYIAKNYNGEAIQRELANAANSYAIIYYNSKAVGFSKLVLNAKHTDIAPEKVAKLDRIYVLPEYHDLKLGYELLKFNIELAKTNGQSGIWLYTWIGNQRAIHFYLRAGFKIIGSHDFLVARGHTNPNHHLFLDLSEKWMQPTR